jgi:hypothetical protein
MHKPGVGPDDISRAFAFNDMIWSRPTDTFCIERAPVAPSLSTSGEHGESRVAELKVNLGRGTPSLFSPTTLSGSSQYVFCVAHKSACTVVTTVTNRRVPQVYEFFRTILWSLIQMCHPSSYMYCSRSYEHRSTFEGPWLDRGLPLIQKQASNMRTRCDRVWFHLNFVEYHPVDHPPDRQSDSNSGIWRSLRSRGRWKRW